MGKNENLFKLSIYLGVFITIIILNLIYFKMAKSLIDENVLKGKYGGKFAKNKNKANNNNKHNTLESTNQVNANEVTLNKEILLLQKPESTSTINLQKAASVLTGIQILNSNSTTPNSKKKSGCHSSNPSKPSNSSNHTKAKNQSQIIHDFYKKKWKHYWKKLNKSLNNDLKTLNKTLGGLLPPINIKQELVE